MKNGNQGAVASLVEGSANSSHFSSTEDLCQSFVAHKGYLTDKWEQYLPVYQSIFSFFKQRGLPVRLLEVGVQNGGSLQLWAEYFPAGSEIFGIDINPACASLEVGHDVSILIGDASNPLILESLIGDAKFDIIIDDGSHKSDDIIATFLACFPRLKSGGVYIVEDLHCSYWQSHGGGFRRPSAAIEMLKCVIDGLNSDHFEVGDVERMAASEYQNLQEFGRSVAQISFFDSLAVITKSIQEKTEPHKRILAGQVAHIDQVIIPLINDTYAIRKLILTGKGDSTPLLLDRLASANETNRSLQIEISRLRAKCTEAARLLHEGRQKSDHTAKNDVSVAAIIPLYNGAQFIREALESVLAQTEPPEEIIVVDDGSTDDGAEIVSNMAALHPIRLIRKTNGGIGSARNRGIAECKSTHIALLDQDDVWYEDHLAVLKRPFANGNVPDLALVYANLDHIDKSGRMLSHRFLDAVISAHPKKSLFDCLHQDMFILPGASIFTKAAFEQVGCFDERLSGYEDDDLFLRMFSAGCRSIYLQESSVTKWRIYSGSTSYSPRMAKSRMIYFHKLVETYPGDPGLNQYWARDVISPRFFNIACNEFIYGVKQKDLPRIEKAWADIQEVVPFMPNKVRRRMALVSPLFGLVYRGPFRNLTLGLLRFVNRKRKKKVKR